MNDSRPFEDQLPWLQPVEDEDEPSGLSARKMLAAALVVMMAALIVAATFFWLGRRETPVAGPPELIHAPPGPYKVKPPNPGGLDISAESQTAFETSAGEDRDAQLDTSKLAECGACKASRAAETGRDRRAGEAGGPAPEPAPKATGGTGSVIQLGAFANKAQAERAWTALSARFPSVAALNKMIVPVQHGIRLRAGAGSAPDAKQVCDTLKAAGENCFVAQ